MDDRFGVGFALERVSLRLQFLAQLEEILDNAVVNDDEVAAAITVGMGVNGIRLAVRGPAGVPNPDRAGDGLSNLPASRRTSM